MSNASRVSHSVCVLRRKHGLACACLNTSGYKLQILSCQLYTVVLLLLVRSIPAGTDAGATLTEKELMTRATAPSVLLPLEVLALRVWTAKIQLEIGCHDKPAQHVTLERHKSKHIRMP